MIMRTLATAAVLAILAAPALAGQCIILMAEFDVAFLLNTEGHEEATLKRAMEFRELGEVLHDAGEHDESQELLRRAFNVLTECRC